MSYKSGFVNVLGTPRTISGYCIIFQVVLVPHRWSIFNAFNIGVLDHMDLRPASWLLICAISVQSHLVPPEETEGHDQLKKWCEYAYSCFHDKIYVCGRGAQQTRTFLDVCDMYEYSCETNQIFIKIRETDSDPRCPDPGRLG